MKPVSLALLALSLSLSVLGAPILRNPQPIPIGTKTVGDLLSADINGDGHSDLLIVNPSKDVVVLMNNGTGPFAAPVITPNTSGVGRPGIGDVTGDGKVDLVIPHATTPTVLLMTGHGDGTFTLTKSIGTTGRPGTVTVADFNGDDHADFAVGLSDSQYTSFFVDVHLGNGAGQFSYGGSTPVSYELRSLIPEDMNADGKMDLIAGSNANNRVLIGSGTGTFSTKGGVTAGGAVAGDFNHDGIRDVAVAAGGSQNYVAVALGAGDGSLGSASLYVVGYESDSIAAADVDDDGHLDLLAASVYGCEVTVLRGKADGTFNAPQSYLSGPNAWRIVAGDFDRDGNQDFVTADSNTTVWALSFVRGNGDGTFRTYRAFHTGSVVPISWPGFGSSGGTVADLDNDGRGDAIVIQRYPSASTYDLSVLLNDGAGKLGAPMLTDTGASNWGGAPMFCDWRREQRRRPRCGGRFEFRVRRLREDASRQRRRHVRFRFIDRRDVVRRPLPRSLQRRPVSRSAPRHGVADRGISRQRRRHVRLRDAVDGLWRDARCGPRRRRQARSPRRE